MHESNMPQTCNKQNFRTQLHACSDKPSNDTELLTIMLHMPNMNKTTIQFHLDHCSTNYIIKTHITCSNTNTFNLKIEKSVWMQNIFLLSHNVSCRYRWKNGIYPIACIWMNYSLNRCLWENWLRMSQKNNNYSREHVSLPASLYRSTR